MTSPAWKDAGDQSYWNRQAFVGLQEAEDPSFSGLAGQRGSRASLSPGYFRDGLASALSTPTSSRRTAVRSQVPLARPDGLVSTRHLSVATSAGHDSPSAQVRATPNGTTLPQPAVANNTQGKEVSGNEHNSEFASCPNPNSRERLLSRLPEASPPARHPSAESLRVGGGGEGCIVGRTGSSSSTSYDAALFLHPCLAAVQQLNILASWMAGEFRRQQLQELESAATRAAWAARVRRKQRESKRKHREKKLGRPRGALSSTLFFEDGGWRQFSVTERLLNPEDSQESRDNGQIPPLIGNGAQATVAGASSARVMDSEPRQDSVRGGGPSLGAQQVDPSSEWAGVGSSTFQPNKARLSTSREQYPAESPLTLSSAQVRQHEYLLQLFQLLRIGFPKGGAAGGDGLGSAKQCVKVIASAEYVHFSVDELRVELAAAPASFVLLTSIEATRTSQVLHFSFSVGDRNQAFRQNRRITRTIVDGAKANEPAARRGSGRRPDTQMEKWAGGDSTASLSEATVAPNICAQQPQSRPVLVKPCADRSTSRTSAACPTTRMKSSGIFSGSRQVDRLRSRRASPGRLRTGGPLHSSGMRRDRADGYVGSDSELGVSEQELAEGPAWSTQKGVADSGIPTVNKSLSTVSPLYGLSSVVDEPEAENRVAARDSIRLGHGVTGDRGDLGQLRAFWDPSEVPGAEAGLDGGRHSGPLRNAGEGCRTVGERPANCNQPESAMGGVIEMRATVRLMWCVAIFSYALQAGCPAPPSTANPSHCLPVTSSGAACCLGS